MKTPRRSLIWLTIFLLCSVSSYSQSHVFWLTITDSTAIDHIDTIGTDYIPTFTDLGVQSTFSTGGGGISIEHAMPFADNLCLRRIWRVKGADSAFMNRLVSNYPALFPGYELLPECKLLSHYPNDWTQVSHPTGSGYLDFIGAPDAWDDNPLSPPPNGTKGDSTVIIAITDDDFDTTTVELKDNSVAIINNTWRGDYHGTQVASVAACRTNNDTMFAAIGYKCKMNLANIDSDDYSTSANIIKDTRGGRVRVLNGSWGGSLPGPLTFTGSKQVVFDEVYENGVSGVFGAGNGIHDSDDPSWYFYPASNDFNLSVTSVGYIADTGMVNLKDIHEAQYAGDSTTTHAHNDRVDICAPGWGMNVLYGGNTWISTSGTSFAAPMVAGTCALMYSQQACLTPYQVEFLLKKNSKDIYRETFDGVNYYNYKYYDGHSRYTSRLGAGRLQADKAVLAADTFECNDAETRTMTIEGVSLTHNCLPGTVAGVDTPRLKIVRILNGKPPYRYLWTPIQSNNVGLSSLTDSAPKITQAYTVLGYPPAILYYRLAVYDNSEIQKVATVRFRAILHNDSTSDLAIRDSYFDMLDEPNSQYDVNHQHYDIWHSPDIWNRDTSDGLRFHEDPQYFSSGNPNFIYVRVRNVGCARNDSDASALHLYWTLASTGEKWRVDWDSTTHVPSSGSGLPSTIPAGGEITIDTVTPPVIPSLVPGDSAIIAIPWHPRNPADYAAAPPLKNVDVCILARLLEFHVADSGLHTVPESTRSASNINNNNNIATLNLSVVNKGRLCASCRTLSGNNDVHRVYVSNSEDSDKVFTIDMVTQKDIEKYLSGDISKYIYATLALDSLYDRWQAGGAHGHYMSKNDTTKTVTYDPSSPLRLEDITLHPGEHFPVDITFIQRSGVNVRYDVNDSKIHFRQFIHENNTKHLYGSVAYSVNVGATDSAQQRSSSTSNSSGTRTQLPAFYTVYPNPTSGLLNIRYSGSDNATVAIMVTDVSGKTVFKKNDITMQNGLVYAIKMSSLASGTYFIQITDGNGFTDTKQFTKQ